MTHIKSLFCTLALTLIGFSEASAQMPSKHQGGLYEQEEGKSILGHGTLVVVLPYKNGVLLMSDKETRLELGEHLLEKRNDRVKIVQLGPSMAGFCTATTMVAKPAGRVPGTENLRFQILFDAPIELMKYFETHQSESIESSIVGLQKHLGEKSDSKCSILWLICQLG